jgi:prepilin-type N-terminal cleavage/methylation domain-containing protein
MIGKQKRKSSGGYTLLEILIALTLVGVISAGVAMAVWNIFFYQSRNISHMTAIKQVESALHWITEDTLQAQIVNVNGTDYFVDLYWTDLSGSSHEAKYQMDTASKVLTRCFDNGPVVVIAGNVDVNQTVVSFTGGKLVINLTVNAVGYTSASASREVNIFPRAMQS